MILHFLSVHPTKEITLLAGHPHVNVQIGTLQIMGWGGGGQSGRYEEFRDMGAKNSEFEVGELVPNWEP